MFEAYPLAYTALRYIGGAYMLWLAWKIAHAVAPGTASAAGKPLTFLQAAAFQWVNPKAWAMALGAIAAYAPEPSLATIGIVAASFAAVNLPSVSVWAGAGQILRRWLDDPVRLRVFNWTMAVLLVLSLIPVLQL